MMYLVCAALDAFLCGSVLVQRHYSEPGAPPHTHVCLYGFLMLQTILQSRNTGCKREEEREREGATLKPTLTTPMYIDMSLSCCAPHKSGNLMLHVFLESSSACTHTKQP